MKIFTVYRPNVPADTHDENQRNAADQPQFEGVIFDTGKCVIQWLTSVGSVSVFNSFDDMMKIHGHPEYGTYILWSDQPKNSQTQIAESVPAAVQKCIDRIDEEHQQMLLGDIFDDWDSGYLAGLSRAVDILREDPGVE